MERQHEGHGVIGTGVSVKNDFLAGDGRGGNYGEKNEKEEEPDVAAWRE